MLGRIQLHLGGEYILQKLFEGFPVRNKTIGNGPFLWQLGFGKGLFAKVKLPRLFGPNDSCYLGLARNSLGRNMKIDTEYDGRMVITS